MACIEDTNMQQSSKNSTCKDFEKIMNKYVDRIFDKNMFVNIATTELKDVYRKDKALFMSVASEIESEMRVEMGEKVAEHIASTGLLEKMAMLDEIKANAVSAGPAWRPSGNVSEDVRPHLVAVKLQFRDELAKIEAECEQEMRAAESELRLAIQSSRKSMRELTDLVKTLAQYKDGVDASLSLVADVLSKRTAKI